MLLLNLLKQFLRSMNTVKWGGGSRGVGLKKYFNKNLIMTEEEEQFLSSYRCWVCEKLIENDEEKVRDHYIIVT